jgi:SAM-dependent MidA family methyltransferase
VREQVTRNLSSRLATNGGVALIIDYGHARSGRGDTLQAVRGHRFSPVLADPGEQDLTSHVDFEAVQRAARDAGAAVTAVVTQGEWLARLGIERRAQSLTRSNPERANDVEQALQRLTAADQMGELFKIVAIHAPDWPTPAGFE